MEDGILVGFIVGLQLIDNEGALVGDLVLAIIIRLEVTILVIRKKYLNLRNLVSLRCYFMLPWMTSIVVE